MELNIKSIYNNIKQLLFNKYLIFLKILQQIQYLPSTFKDYFFQLVVRFEKQKENHYQRKYKKGFNIVSEIGGFTQSLLAIGFIICCSLSELQMNEAIINEAFNFNTEIQEIQAENRDRQKSYQSQNYTQASNRNFTIQNGLHKLNLDVKKEEFLKPGTYINYQEQLSSQQQNDKQKDIQFVFPNQLQPKQEIQNRRITKQNSGDFPKSIMSLKPIEKLNQNSQLQKNQSNIQSPLSSTNLKVVKGLENSSYNKRKQSQVNAKIILSKIIQNKQIDSPTKVQDEQLNQTQNSKIKSTPQLKNAQIKENTPNENINNNKFKKLLGKATSSMRLSIGEYLSYFFWPFGEIKRKKQIIDYSMNKLYYHLDVLYVIKKLLEVDKLKRMILDQDQIELFEYLPKPTIHIEDVFKKQNQQENINQDYEILYQDKRTELQKTQAAYQAFMNISQRNYRSQLDQKILEYLDPNVIQLFTLNDNNQVNQIPPFQEDYYNKNQNGSFNYTNAQLFNLNNDYKTNVDLQIPIDLDKNCNDTKSIKQYEFNYDEEVQSQQEIGIPQEQPDETNQEIKTMKFQKLNPPNIE